MGARFSVHTLHWKTRTDITTGALTHVNIYIKERLFIRLDRLFIIYFLYLCTRLNRGSAWGQTTGCKHGLTIGLARYWVYDRPITPPWVVFFKGGVFSQNPLAPPCNDTGGFRGYVFSHSFLHKGYSKNTLNRPFFTIFKQKKTKSAIFVF